MSLREDVLDEAEIFDGEHLTEVAIVLLGDGAGALVGAAGREHLERCGACSARVADAALASAEVHLAFTDLRDAAPAPVTRTAEHEASPAEGRAVASTGHAIAPEPELARARGAGWAGGWIAAGLVVAAVASGPALSDLAGGLARLREGAEVLLRVTLQVEQALRLASGRMETMRMLASWIAAGALVAVGSWIARRGPGVGKVQEEAR